MMQFKPEIDKELAYELFACLGSILVDSEYINEDNELDRRLKQDQVDQAWDALELYRQARFK
jgi:hypothetical protein